MLIAQVTDVHLGFEPGNPGEFNRVRLDQVIAHIANQNPQPDMLLLTGDIADLGDVDSYQRMAEALAPLGMPIWPIAGNHDNRANLAAVFPQIGFADDFIQYAVDAGPVRLLMLDTVETGRHGGAYCDTRAAWLSARLAEDRNKPTIIVMHHPPVETGIAWMTTHSQEPWVARFAAAIEGAPNIAAILCGHLHRATSIGWRGRSVCICPSTAPQVTLSLAPFDPKAPDGRPLIVAHDPGYALHYWNGADLVSHFATSAKQAVLARFDSSLQSLIRDCLSEQPRAEP